MVFLHAMRCLLSRMFELYIYALPFFTRTFGFSSFVVGVVLKKLIGVLYTFVLSCQYFPIVQVTFIIQDLATYV